MFASIPANVLRRLGIVAQRTIKRRLPDGRVDYQQMGEIGAQVDDNVGTIMCVFTESDHPPVIGSHTLTTLLLDIDPDRNRFVPLLVLA